MMMYIYISEDNLVESVLCFYYVDLGNQIQMSGLVASITWCNVS